MAVYQALLLNTVVPQIQAAQAGDSYVMVVNATTPALRITQTGTGNALEVEDSANPDATPFVVTAAGDVGVGTSSPGYKLDVSTTSGDTQAAVYDRSSGSSAARLDLRTSGTGASQWYIQTGNTSSGLNGSLRFYDQNIGERMRLDTSGNLGLGVTPSAWRSINKVLQVNRVSLYDENGNGMYLGHNFFENSSGNYIYLNSDFASYYSQSDSKHLWFTAPSGTAGNAISFTQALTLDASSNLLLNGTTAGASSVGTFAIFNGTAPTGSVTNGVILYAEDVSSSSELKVRDEAGNVTTLSPHNFELIPEGPSEDMAWSYYSERDGKRINVDMLKAIRLLEKISGEKLVYFA